MTSGPNLLFIFSDQHAADVAGCYGDGVVATPNIDRIAAGGARFDNAYCPSPICVPSRMSMLTARYPHRQECWTNDDIVPSHLPTWPAMMGVSGLHPVLVGRMHAMGPDQMRGYAERLVGDHSPNWPGVKRHSMGVLEGTNDPQPESIARSGLGRNVYQMKDEDVTARAVDWLSTEGAARQAKGERFCLTVGYILPHAPYVANAESYARYAGRVPPPRRAPAEPEHHYHAWWRENREIADVSEADADRCRTAYWALVDRMDANIGRLLAALDTLGATDDTLIVYASDHGDHVGERGLWWKHTFFDESVRMPLVMRLPGAIPAGSVRPEIVNLTDLAQTMLEAMGAPLRPHADGRSFWPLACGENQDWENETFSEYCTDAVPAWTGGRAVRQRMIRSGRWKLVLYDREPPQLFDMRADPDETSDLADMPAHHATLRRLMARLTDGWSAERTGARMVERRVEKDLMAQWAHAVQPPNAHIWPFDPEASRLDRTP